MNLGGGICLRDEKWVKVNYDLSQANSLRYGTIEDDTKIPDRGQDLKGL